MIDKIANSQCSILAKDDVFNDIQVLRLLDVRSIGGRHAVVRICRRYDTQQGPESVSGLASKAKDFQRAEISIYWFDSICKVGWCSIP